MFEMLVGYPPFYSEDPMSTCRKVFVVSMPVILLLHTSRTCSCKKKKKLLLSDSSSYKLCDCNLQIVNWRSHLKFPEEARLSLEAKDLISKLLCNVDQRLGTKGAHEIKVYTTNFLQCYLMLNIS